jgi:uncharacterized protein (DUF1684 family)
VIEVARRGGSDIVRPRDRQYPLRTRYAGTPTLEPEENRLPVAVEAGEQIPTERR